jgi:hypothetical protein
MEWFSDDLFRRRRSQKCAMTMPHHTTPQQRLTSSGTTDYSDACAKTKEGRYGVFSLYNDIRVEEEQCAMRGESERRYRIIEATNFLFLYCISRVVYFVINSSHPLFCPLPPSNVAVLDGSLKYSSSVSGATARLRGAFACSSISVPCCF